MIEERLEEASVGLARRTSRRSFLGRLGTGFVALVGGPLVAVALRPDRAEAYHLCGHIFTTGSCPHPYHPKTRIDSYGYPIHPKHGYPVDDRGRIYVSREQKRSKTCQDITANKYPHSRPTRIDGGWSRCCGGRVRRIVDCCSYSRTRINGDASLTGYCYNGRRVFCIMYRDTNIKC
ncbi:MAG: twin-arginine translocation signal domain-containing protein [Actinomycetota bacterium]